MVPQFPVSDKRKSIAEIDLIAYSTDASFYKLKPELILRPANEHEIIAILNYARLNSVPLTFRAAGTSLSGQSLTNSVLIDLSGGWKNFRYDKNNKTITAEPGVIAGHINKYLTGYNRIIGPDPASINACMIGGIIANNSSGMRSGINQNAYSSVKSLKYILPGGLVIDSATSNANNSLKYYAPDIFNGICNIKTEINNSAHLREKIKQKYRIKNTVGYSLNSFIDFDSPVEILSHLLIGSEGTLGFISEARLDTFEDKSEKLTGLIFFSNVSEASRAIIPLRVTGASALEIIDYKSLLSISDKVSGLNLIDRIPENLSALLIEYQGTTEEELKDREFACIDILKQFNLPSGYILTRDKRIQSNLWAIRKGLLPALGAVRQKGTTFILEDICVDVERFSEVIPELNQLFTKWNYNQTGVYGHGMDGNLHFMLTQDFSSDSEIERYKGFMNDLSELIIVKFDGSLKAEHGTGRNIAPFVKKEWGEHAYDIMKRIKKLIDPENILNPGVIINDDENIHLQNIKTIPIVNDELDKCIDCGFCESVCPSRDFTITPRKRIGLIRDYSSRNNISDILFRNDYQFQVIDTCAADSLCSVACPVGINTGDFVKYLRKENQSKKAIFISRILSKNHILLEWAAILSLNSVHLLTSVLSTITLNKISAVLGKYIFNKEIYKWNKYIGKPATLKPKSSQNADFVYFPSCVTRMLGKPVDGKLISLTEALIVISRFAGLEVAIPTKIRSYCCGQIYSSKGLAEAAAISANKLIEFLWNETEGGIRKVIVDSTSCFQTIINFRDKLSIDNKSKYDNLNFMDSTQFIEKYILPKINISGKLSRIVLHPTCSAVKLNIAESMMNIAIQLSDEVLIPDNSGCCGMAGDRGLMYPGLTASATKHQAGEIACIDADGYFSSNIPCEIGMSSATDKQYLSIAYLVLEQMKKQTINL